MRLRLTPILLIAVFGLAGCGGTSTSSFTQSDFSDLGFVVGVWKGAAPGEPVFYETYEFANDTLMHILYHADSTMSAADTGRVYLSEGGIYHEAGDGVWRVYNRDTDGFHFGPWLNVDNALTWQSQTNDAWRAVLHFSDGTGLTYDLIRMTP
jgi:hypothetical protein